MADIPSEHAHDVREALRIVVTDPDHGAATLSSPQAMSNLLKDLLPDAPREKNLLVAAAEANLAAIMLDHVSQGIDATSALRLAAASFGANTHFTEAACTWVATELAVALSLGPELAAGRSELPAGEITMAAGPVQRATTRAPEALPGQDAAHAEAAGLVLAAAPRPASAAAQDMSAGAPAAIDHAGSRSVVALLPAAAVFAGVLALIAASATPVYSSSVPGRIWGDSSSASWFIASAPTAALAVAVVAGVLLLAKRARLAAGGAALASGIEVTACFLAVWYQQVHMYSNPMRDGLVLGLVAGLLLIAGGVLALRGRAHGAARPAA